ncbi:Morn repeat protein [Pandoravirus inopinatum]|uniref:Morn repeat protein n=1 Tax=Pandoravirus inopinatum TaxID=1605721 RepID=A0A0B5JA25_9VIRU|nr:Morn repeat protein [Pandoravirus inopinatum]AJF97726.1 Morn repeat protein [Pandoravirus inopinatum]
MEREPLLALGRLTLGGTASRRRPRPVDFDALLVDHDATRPPPARRRRLESAEARWKRKRVDNLFGCNPTDDASDTKDTIDSVASMIRKRLRVADDQEEGGLCRQHRRAGESECAHGALEDSFAVLPDELVLAVMAFCDAHALARLACASTRLAGLASDNLLWRNLYLAALPPCTYRGLACLADAVDAWCFAADGRHGDDALDHGSSQSPTLGTCMAGDSSPVPGRLGATLGTDGGVVSSPSCSRSSGGYNGDDDTRAEVLVRWWNQRCMRLTRMAADRITGCGMTQAHAACPHPPPSLVRARGYRWAYAVAASAALVRKVHHGVGHAHRIVHRGPRNGLAFQCEMCLAAGHSCGLVWRWGRFVDCFLSGLGSEAASVPPKDTGQNGPHVTSTETAMVTAGIWTEGIARGITVRRVPAMDNNKRGMIIIGTAAAHAKVDNDPMEQDQTMKTRHPTTDDESGTDDSGDDDLAVAGDGFDDQTTRRPNNTAVIYYAPETLGHAWSYAGECTDDQRDGYGALTCEASSSSVYEGDWRRDMWHGRGVLRIQGAIGGASPVFTGRFVRGRPRGRGVLDLGDGTHVDASWHSLPDGSVAPRCTGHVIYANGDRVLCDWGRPTSATTQEHTPRFCLGVVVKGFRFAEHTSDPGGRSFAGREVGAEWGPWPTEYDDATVVDPQVARSLPAHCGGDDLFCARGWTVMLPRVFWPPAAHPLEPLFARYVDQDRIGWSTSRASRALL